MNDQKLRAELDLVGSRFRRLRLSAVLTLAWLALAVAILLIPHHLIAGLTVLVATPLALAPLLLFILRPTRDPLWLARRIEQKHPDLDARLLAALEQQPTEAGKPLGFLQDTVVREAVDHAHSHRWSAIVPANLIAFTTVAQMAALVCLVFSLGITIAHLSSHGIENASVATVTTGAFKISVEPGDTSIERGTSMLVLARFNGRLPSDAQLLSRDVDGTVHPLSMSKSLNDPVFATRLASIKTDISYAVKYADTQTQWYKAAVFDYPDLKQADAHLKFPTYTRLAEKDEKDVRSVTAVEGTSAKLTFHLNKPVSQARLVPATQPAAKPLQLTADSADPNVYSIAMDLKQSQRFHLELVDQDGRANRQPPELAVNVNPNKPPEVKPIWPARDVDVSPLQELSVRAKVSDDFGVVRAGLTYSFAGQPPRDVVLASDVPALEQREVSNLLPLEAFAAQPDQLVSYFFWAEDYAADGTVRRTSGDMFFAEVRPFDEIYRQGQQPADGQQQSQQNNQNAQRAEQQADSEKEVIAATWKVIRRETATAVSTPFVPDVNLINQSQASVRQKTAGMADQLTDARSRGFLTSALNFMDTATARLNEAATGSKIAPLPAALSAEQAAYQELLKLRAREHEVVRSNRQQGSQSSSSASSRRQQQLDQLQLDQEQNRYETQRAAAQQQQQQQDNPQQRETRQVLSRLRELAQRQEDLNRQMREMQSALQKAQDDAQREDIQRQLARLRDQQQQQLRDTDELRDRMAQPENQQRMADSSQQLEQTRENVRKAADALDKGAVPDAAAAGARAGEQLNTLRDDFRRSAAGQQADAMNQMRQDARQLDDNQQQLNQKLSQLDNTNQRSLRDTGDRQQLAKQLADQKQQWDKLMENMRTTSQDAEANEPLLSKQLYDTIRKASENQTGQALDAGRQLLERGFANESGQAETEAAKGIAQVRQEVEQAAGSVLGDETESLRKARNQLDQLSNDLQREIDRNRPAGANPTPTTGPALARNGAPRGATTRNAADRMVASTPSTQPGNLARGNQPASQRGRQQGQGQQASNQSGSDPQNGQPQNGQPQQGDQQARAGQQPGQGQQGGQPGAGGQPNSQNAQAGNPGSQQARAGSQQRSGRGGGLRGNQQAQQPGDSQPQPGGDQQASANPDAQPPGQQGAQNQNGQNQPGDQRQASAAGGGGGGAGGQDQNAFSGVDNAGGSPITGNGFRDWSDRLRDVEEMVNDARLRAQAATIRERARDARILFRNHARPPNWDMVNDQIGKPLAELRDAVSQELAKHESAEALVPLDREAVPPQYADQVRRYYERLGSGK